MESPNSKGQRRQGGDSAGEGGLEEIRAAGKGGLNQNDVVLTPDASKRHGFDGLIYIF